MEDSEPAKSKASEKLRFSASATSGSFQPSLQSKEKKDEDAEIDFSKITNLFRRNSGKQSFPVSAISGEKTSASDAKDNRSSDENKIGSAASEEKKESDGDEIDVGKAIAGIKGIFKRIKSGGDKTEESKARSEDEVDIKSALNFVSKHHVALLVILGLIVSVGLGFSIRMQSGNLGFTDGWARNSIDATISSDVSSFISQTYPNLPDKNRQMLVSEELGKARAAGIYTFKTGQYAGQTINIEEQVKGTSQQFKAFFQDEKGKNYIPDIDPYYWWRYARNIVEKGRIGDEVKDGIQWDNHQLAPVGRPIGPQDKFYPQAIAAFYRVGSVFGGKDLARTLMFLPVFLSALTTLIVFLITRRIAGNIAAFFAATMVGVHASLIGRTMFGHADSDALIVFMSVLVLWLFIEAFTAKKLKWKLSLAALAGFSTGIYSLSWGGWWWIFDLIMAASVGTLAAFLAYEISLGLNKGLSGKALAMNAIKLPASRKAMVTAAAYFLSAGFFISIFTNASTFITTPLASIGFRAIKTPVVDTASPNVLRTVAELNEGTVMQGINQIGNGIFIVALAGIALIILRTVIEALKKEKDNDKMLRDVFYAAVLSLWFAVTLYSVTKGIRFTLMIVPTFSIAFGVLFGMAANYPAQWLSREFKINKFALTAAIFIFLFFAFPGIGINFRNGYLMILFLALASAAVYGGHILGRNLKTDRAITMLAAFLIVSAVSLPLLANTRMFSSSVVDVARGTVNSDIPLINDAWYNALASIKENSKEDAIITSWWDFGHHFKALADRPVTFDGTTQSSPEAHWVGRLFMTDDEKEAVGILRMLDCGAYTGTEEIRNFTGDSVKAVMLTKRIIMMERDEAKAALVGEGFTDGQAESVLKLTHCSPPEAFVIASEDMIGKSGVWAHFGGWNYTKADIVKATRGMKRDEAARYMEEKFGMAKEEANGIFLQMQGLTDDRKTDEWISPFIGISGGVERCSESDGLIRCGDGLIVNTTTHDAFYPAPQGNLHPISIVYPTADGKVVEKRFENNTIPQELSVLVFPSGSGYGRVVASPQLINSIFLRMFYLKGQGLTHFKLLTRQTGFTGTDVWVWKADWEGRQENIMPELIPKKEVGIGDEVTFNYIGYLEDGTVFDSSITNFQTKPVTKDTQLDSLQDYSPFTFTTGRNSVIPGFEKGLIGAKLNEEKSIAIPPEEGYNVPGHPLYNKTLHFKIKVTKIR